jgi:RNA polymerase sigma-70 factor (ECF subfamily)
MTFMDRDTELALVERVKAGDAAAFEEVHAAFNTRLFTFLVRLSRRRDVAEDLLEDTWLRLVSRAHSLRSDTRLGPWLFTVARNRYFSYCRSRLLEASHATDLMGLWPSPSRVTSPFEDAAASEIERRIESALASLPATYREVLLLVGVEGLQPIDVAAICGVTPATLRQRLHRARDLLARRLDRRAELTGTTASEVTT